MRIALYLLLATLAGLAPAAADDGYPRRPIRLLVPNAAGGPTDVYARYVGTEISKTLGQQVVVENRDGAGGQIAMRAVLAAEPDGYTLIVGNTGSAAVAAVLNKNAGYDPSKDFVAITMMTAVPVLLVVRSDLGVSNVKELVAKMRANPASVNFASSGVGQSTHMASELFRLMAGTDTVIAPTRGASQAVNEMVAGSTQAMFDTSTALPHVKNGTLKALAVGGRTRSGLLPNVPTVQEEGMQGFDITSWYALMAKAGTPKPIVDRLNAEVVAVLKRQETKDRFALLNTETTPSTTEEAQAYIRSEMDNWRGIIARTGIKTD